MDPSLLCAMARHFEIIAQPHLDALLDTNGGSNGGGDSNGVSTGGGAPASANGAAAVPVQRQRRRRRLLSGADLLEAMVMGAADWEEEEHSDGGGSIGGSGSSGGGVLSMTAPPSSLSSPKLIPPAAASSNTFQDCAGGTGYQGAMSLFSSAVHRAWWAATAATRSSAETTAPLTQPEPSAKLSQEQAHAPIGDDANRSNHWTALLRLLADLLTTPPPNSETSGCSTKGNIQQAASSGDHQCFISGHPSAAPPSTPILDFRARMAAATAMPAANASTAVSAPLTTGTVRVAAGRSSSINTASSSVALSNERLAQSSFAARAAQLFEVRLLRYYRYHRSSQQRLGRGEDNFTSSVVPTHPLQRSSSSSNSNVFNKNLSSPRSSLSPSPLTEALESPLFLLQLALCGHHHHPQTSFAEDSPDNPSNNTATMRRQSSSSSLPSTRTIAAAGVPPSSRAIFYAIALGLPLRDLDAENNTRAGVGRGRGGGGGGRGGAAEDEAAAFLASEVSLGDRLRPRYWEGGYHHRDGEGISSSSLCLFLPHRVVEELVPDGAWPTTLPSPSSTSPQQPPPPAFASAASVNAKADRRNTQTIPNSSASSSSPYSALSPVAASEAAASSLQAHPHHTAAACVRAALVAAVDDTVGCCPRLFVVQDEARIALTALAEDSLPRRLLPERTASSATTCEAPNESPAATATPAVHVIGLCEAHERLYRRATTAATATTGGGATAARKGMAAAVRSPLLPCSCTSGDSAATSQAQQQQEVMVVPLTALAIVSAPIFFATADLPLGYCCHRSLYQSVWRPLHRPSFEVLHAFIVFETLIVAACGPRLIYACHAQLQCPPLALAVQWILTCGASCLAPNEALQAWDVLHALVHFVRENNQPRDNNKCMNSATTASSSGSAALLAPFTWCAVVAAAIFVQRAPLIESHLLPSLPSQSTSSSRGDSRSRASLVELYSDLTTVRIIPAVGRLLTLCTVLF